jgi:hypothetical protein
MLSLKFLCVFPLLSLPLHAAAVCDPNQLQGPYGFQLSGAASISGQSQPATSIGRIVFDGQGGISGYSSVMFAGFLLGNPVTGTYESRSDCTASWSLQDDSGAYQHFSGEVSAGGKRVQFRQTDPGGPQSGILARTSDQCKSSDLRKRYEFRLYGSFTPMLPGEAPATVDAKGDVQADSQGNFMLTLRDKPLAATEITVEVESDCIVHLQLALPAEGGETPAPITLRGILVDDAKEILAIQTDPGWMAAAHLVAPD